MSWSSLDRYARSSWAKRSPLSMPAWWRARSGRAVRDRRSPDGWHEPSLRHRAWPAWRFEQARPARMRTVTRYLAALLLGLVAAIPFQSSAQPLPSSVRAQVRHAGTWHPGCPVALSQLRLLSVSYVGFDGQAHTGQLVVNRSAAAPLARVFAKLYALHFPIRHMSVADRYGPLPSRPADGDVSASFECRQASPSPCVGTSGTGSWSE